jgi:aryl-alcohol dehydrogenase-like predicted oxidoreductase
LTQADIYLLHRDDPKVPVGPLVETLNELREEGKIGIFGGSNWSCDRIDKANEYAYAHDMFGFQVSSPAYSLAAQDDDPWGGGCVDLSGEAHRRDRAWYQEEGIEVFAYASLAHGFLSGKFRADEAGRACKVLDDFAVKGYCSDANFMRLKRAESLAREKRVTIPQLALAWVLNQPLLPMAVCSASTSKRMISNLKALDVKLTAEEIRWLSEG